MLKLLSGHKRGEDMSRAPFLSERPSRSSGDSGYNLLLNSDYSYPLPSERPRLRSVAFIISILTAIVTVETLLLVREFHRLPPRGPIPQCETSKDTSNISN